MKAGFNPDRRTLLECFRFTCLDYKSCQSCNCSGEKLAFGVKCFRLFPTIMAVQKAHGTSVLTCDKVHGLEGAEQHVRAEAVAFVYESCHERHCICTCSK